MPYESLYSGDLDLTFRVGRDMFEREFFEKWMNQIVDHSTNTMGYYHSYTRDIEIAQLGPKDRVVYQVRVKECWPKTLNAIELGFDKSSEYTRQVVSLSFREYEVILADRPYHKFGSPFQQTSSATTTVGGGLLAGPHISLAGSMGLGGMPFIAHTIGDPSMFEGMPD